MGKFYILVFIVSVVFIIYVINKRAQQKEDENHQDQEKENQE